MRMMYLTGRGIAAARIIKERVNIKRKPSRPCMYLITKFMSGLGGAACNGSSLADSRASAGEFRQEWQACIDIAWILAVKMCHNIDVEDF
jgi:hypothetical protein